MEKGAKPCLHLNAFVWSILAGKKGPFSRAVTEQKACSLAEKAASVAPPGNCALLGFHPLALLDGYPGVEHGRNLRLIEPRCWEANEPETGLRTLSNV